MIACMLLVSIFPFSYETNQHDFSRKFLVHVLFLKKISHVTIMMLTMHTCKKSTKRLSDTRGMNSGASATCECTWHGSCVVCHMAEK